MLLKQKMKYTFILLLLLLLISPSAMSQQSMMTLNIRYDTQDDKENWWGNRKAELTQLIKDYSPDILGIQEGLHTQVEYLDQALDDYNYIGVGRDDGKTKGEYAAIFYRPSRMQLIASHTYWLSETPEIPSVGWDAAMERIATFGVFLDMHSGDTLHVFNCHFDHMGLQARLNSAKLMLTIIDQKKLRDKKLIVMGDLNCLPEDEPIIALKTLFNDPFTNKKTMVSGPVGTFNGFKDTETLTERIDYILTRNITVAEYKHLDDRRKNGLFISDHLPVFAKFQ
jgi:endonuclease/exonuclease/phosphatase family metal-dependent hydrolase